MTDDVAITVSVRLHTAIMALEAAIDEAKSPREPWLTESLLNSLRWAYAAEAQCKRRLGITDDDDPVAESA